MLCSETELGLAEKADGIMILPQDSKPGVALAEFASDTDIIFELNVTPNRADCLSHLGLARELATLLDRPVNLPDATLDQGKKSVNDWIQVELKDSESCPRYCGRVISGVKVGESPAWLKNSLEAIGLNSVNNIVDVTNYVLFEYGQPLHAFDFSQVKGARITIEKAKDSESFTTLDGTEVKLSAKDLVIRDGERAVALAGVVGGQNSGVSESTTDIFLESAFFTAEGVRRTSRAHGIETDSCYRFSRGVDPEQTLNAMNRAAHLIQKVAGGEVQKGDIDIYPEPLKFNDIFVDPAYVAQRLGYEVSPSDFQTWMERLNCVVAKKDDGFRVTPPTYRWDLHIKEDLVEEYARLHGYDQIEEKLPVLNQEPTTHVESYDFKKRVTGILTGLGLHQAWNYAFIGSGQGASFLGSADGLKKFGLSCSDAEVELLNPISEELSVMRPTLLASLFKNMVHNDHHGNHYGRLFEIAPAHRTDGKEYFEEQRLAFAFWGQKESLWDKGQTNQVVFELKSTVETLLSSLGAKKWRWDKVAMETCPEGFHPSQTVSLFYEGKTIGLLGTVHPSLQQDNKLRGPLAWAEFNFEALMSRQPRTPKFQPLPKFPGMDRDIAFVGPESVSADQIDAVIKKAAGPLLESSWVFDVYQDKALKEAGQRSVAFRLRFQSGEETLKDETINPIRDKVVNSVCQKLGLEIR